MRMDSGSLSGLGAALVVKARLGDDVRKAAIQNVDMTRDELLLMLQRWFKGKLSNSDAVTLKYKDEDGDLITINDDSDLSFAIRSGGVLRVWVSLGASKNGGLDQMEVAAMREELSGIRDAANRLLDGLAFVEEPTDALPKSLPEVRNYANGYSEQAEAPVKEPSPAAVREFDPIPPAAPTHTQPPTPHPPNVYGVGAQFGGSGGSESGRPDTPVSQRSSVAPPSLDASLNASGHFQAYQQQQQENVATITPTIHQQVNALHGSAPTPPINFNSSYPPQQQQQQQAPPPPAVSSPGFAPPTPFAPPNQMNNQSNNQSMMNSGYGAPPPPGPPVSHPQPPQPYHSYSQPQAPSYQPPQQTNQAPGYPAANSFAAPPPPMATSTAPSFYAQSNPPPPAMAPPPTGPPPMGLPPMAPPGGANPFARNTGNPYGVRPGFPSYPAPPQH